MLGNRKSGKKSAANRTNSANLHLVSTTTAAAVATNQSGITKVKDVSPIEIQLGDQVQVIRNQDSTEIKIGDDITIRFSGTGLAATSSSKNEVVPQAETFTEQPQDEELETLSQSLPIAQQAASDNSTLVIPSDDETPDLINNANEEPLQSAYPPNDYQQPELPATKTIADEDSLIEEEAANAPTGLEPISTQVETTNRNRKLLFFGNRPTNGSNKEKRSKGNRTTKTQHQPAEDEAITTDVTQAAQSIPTALPIATQMPVELADEHGQPLLWSNRPLELVDLYLGAQGYYSHKAAIALDQVQRTFNEAGLPLLTPISCIENSNSLQFSFRGSPQAIALYSAKNKPSPLSLVSDTAKSPLEIALKNATGAAGNVRLEIGGSISTGISIFLEEIAPEYTYLPNTESQNSSFKTFFAAGAMRTDLIFKPVAQLNNSTESSPRQAQAQSVAEIGYYSACLETSGNILFVASRGDETAKAALASSVLHISTTKLIANTPNKNEDLNYQICLVEPPAHLGVTPEQREQALQREMVELGVEDIALQKQLSREIQSTCLTLQSLVKLPGVTAYVASTVNPVMPTSECVANWENNLHELTGWLVEQLLDRRNNHSISSRDQSQNGDVQAKATANDTLVLVLEDLTAALNTCGEDLRQILDEGPAVGIYTLAATTYEALTNTTTASTSSILAHFGTLGVFAALDERASVSVWGNNAAYQELGGYGDMFLRTSDNQQVRLGSLKTDERQIRELDNLLHIQEREEGEGGAN